jgi:hypothetical protein
MKNLLLCLLFLLLPLLRVGADTVTLSWSASTDSSVVGYRVYCGSASRDYDTIIDVGNVVSVILILPGYSEDFYIAATAYNNLDMESDYSAEVLYRTKPAPTHALISWDAAPRKTYSLYTSTDLKTWALVAAGIPEGSSTQPCSQTEHARFYYVREENSTRILTPAIQLIP